MIERRKRTPSWISSCTLLLPILMMAGSLAAQELGWPREIEVPEGKVVMYQPQADSFEGNLLTGRAAVSVTPTGKNEPVFGAVWMTSHVAYYRGYHHGWHRGFRAGTARGVRAGYRAGRVDTRIRNQNIYNRQNNVARNARVGRATGTRAPTVARQGSNNVYADRSGNVHHRTQDGWQQRNQGDWSKGSGSQNLQRDYNSRQRGATRSQSYQRSGARRSGGRRR